MAVVRLEADIDAPRDVVYALVGDLARRRDFLPDGWRFLRALSDRTEEVGAAIEVEARIGPGATTQVIQVLEREPGRIVEGPPGGENYLTTWLFLAPAAGDGGEHTTLGFQYEFSYGDWWDLSKLGEWFVRRRLTASFLQMLVRLKALAEREARRG